ncbi:MurR/RpiR family transcriptional regulator [Allocoprobacillus halotolerans]|uniref:MurR/RpiR family transcriptional regulator n=1 Tax=Allocoprobacillus halotolerans TaxID=2944914 RepID=A0ABY5I5Y2_9FIRM|nr:MurR/RpiR family transcriptional regulator [Allocoprobacillus halotolerans]UTY40177.1 MurR/RpiR family transcriptional regulator [Allocoprobacillus halotolerans]
MGLIEKMSDTQLFTAVELSVLNYMTDNMEQIIHMSIQELAKVTYSSNATIIRICKKLGTNGFKDFKYALFKEMEAGKYLKKEVDYSVPFHHNESIEAIIENMSSLHKNTINLINSCLDRNVLDEVSDVILKSRYVFIAAMGDSKISATGFINKLVKIGIYCIVMTDNNEELSFSKNLKPDDCVIFVSYRGNTPKVNQCLREVKKTGCQIIALTSNEKSPVSKYGHYSIIIPPKENEMKITTFYSQIAFTYILNILYSIIFSKINEGKKTF